MLIVLPVQGSKLIYLIWNYAFAKVSVEAGFLGARTITKFWTFTKLSCQMRITELLLIYIKKLNWRENNEIGSFKFQVN